RRFLKSEEHSARIRRLYAWIVGCGRAFQRSRENLEVATAAGGAEFHGLDFWYQSSRSEHHFRREPLRLSLPHLHRWRVLDTAETRAKRDRRGLLVAELSANGAVPGSEFRVPGSRLPLNSKRGTRNLARTRYL